MKTALLLFVLSLSTQFGLAQEPVLTLNVGHKDRISCITFSNDGKYILTGGLDNAIILRDFETGFVLKRFLGHTDKINALSFSPDGSKFVSGSSDNTVRVWDIKSGEMIKSYAGRIHEHQIGVNPVGFLADNESIVYSTNYDLITKNIYTDVETVLIEGSNDDDMVLSDDRKVLITNVLFKMYITDIEKRKSKKFKKVLSNKSIAISHHNSVFASNTTLSKEIQIFNLKNGKLLQTLTGHEGYVRSIAFLWDDKTMVSSDEYGNVLLWETTNWSIISTLKVQPALFAVNPVSYVPFNPNQFVTSGKTITIWDLKNDEPIRVLENSENQITSFAFAPGRNQLCLGVMDSLVFVPLQSSLKSINYIKTRTPYSVKYSKDESKIAVHNGNDYNYGDILVLNAETGDSITSFPRSSSMFYGYEISSDGNRVATYSKDSLKIWSTVSGKAIKSFVIPDKTVYNTAFSQDGTSIYSNTSDYSLREYDIATGKLKKTITIEMVLDVAKFILEKNVAILKNDNVVSLLNLELGKIEKTLYSHSGRFVYTFDLSLDQKTLITFDNFGECIVWDLEASKKINTFKNETGLVDLVKLTPNGNHFFTKDDSGIITLRQTQTSNIIARIVVGSHSNELAIIAVDGRFDATENAMKKLYFINGLDVIPLESLFEKFYTPNLLADLLEIDATDKQSYKPLIALSTLLPVPLVSIIKPSQNSMDNGIRFNGKSFETDQNEIELTVRAVDSGGGVDEIVLYQNGKIVSGSIRGIKAVSKQVEHSDKTFTVSLVDGKNTFKATAFSKERTESIPVELIVNYVGATLSKPDLYILLVGINEYKNSKYNLNYAYADAKSVKEVLETGENRLFRTVQVDFLTNSQATKPSILAAFDQIERKAKPEDVFIFYYAGHGVIDYDLETEFYIVPHDVTQLYGDSDLLREKGISANELKVVSAKIKALKQLFILDACQSGGMMNTLASRGAAEEKALHQLARSTGTYWIAASGSEQFAGEFSELGHGLFTYCLLEGLSGKADGQHDSKVTVMELSGYVNDQVPAISKKLKGNAQYPNTFGFGMDFPLVIIDK